MSYQTGENLRYSKNYNLEIADFNLAGFCSNGIIKESHSAYNTSDIMIKTNGSVEFIIERPKFQKLVSLLNTGKFKGVICLCWDRISRNEQDEIIIKQLIKKGVRFKFVQTTYDKTSSGELHMDIDGMFSKHYSRVISEKVRGVRQKQIKEGKCPYKSPLGYLDKGPDNKPLDPEKAPTVKRLFELYSTGKWSLSQLAKWANKQGLTTKPLRRKRTKSEMLSDKNVLDNIPKISKPLIIKSVEKILKNPFYIGKIKNSGKIINGIHSPLINVSLYNKVQSVLKDKHCSVYYIDKDFFTYRGLVRCDCQRLYTPYQKKGINYYSSKCKSDCDNKKRNIKETDIDKVVEDMLEKIHFSDKELIEIETKLKTDLGNIHEKRNRNLNDLHSQQKRVYADLHYLEQNKITLLRTGTMNIEDFKTDTDKLNNELEQINIKFDAYRVTEQKMVQYIVTFSELVKRAKAYYKNALDSEKQKIATEVFSELYLYNGKLASYKAKEGYEALLKRHKNNVGTA